MVLGLYGLLYAYAARHLSLARPIVAVGLLGKVLGPIGWAATVGSGEWPARTITLVFLDDLVWWLPFSLFLLEGTRLRDRLSGLAPFLSAALNAAATLGMVLLLRPGTEVEPDPIVRAAYVREHAFAWRAGWGLWLAAASSLVAFFAWWSARATRRGLALLGFSVAAVGLLFDATAESIFVGWFPDRMDLSYAAGVLSGTFANGGYAAGGVLLTLASPGLPARLRVWAFLVWVSAFALAVAAVVASVPALVVTTALTMGLFLPWVVVAGRRLA